MGIFTGRMSEDLTLLGVTAPRLHPRRVGIPLVATALNKIKGKLRKKGGQGVLPLGCLPLWRREGVTLTQVENIYRLSMKRDSLIVIIPGLGSLRNRSFFGPVRTWAT